jgi:hypothetical protein
MKNKIMCFIIGLYPAIEQNGNGIKSRGIADLGLQIADLRCEI